MLNAQESIDSLIKLLIDPQLYKNIEERKKSQSQSNSQLINQQIQNLDIEDYLQLFAHQKKNLNIRRWKKLSTINQSLQMQQQSYKHFFAIASQANYRRLQHPGYYKLLLNIVQKYPPTFFLAIQKDIPRTLSNTNPFQQPLRNILCAYAIRNPSLLYCQGINYIVAYLLMNEMSPQQTFWFLACLIQNCLPDDYFKDLTTVSITTCIFNQVLDEVFPEFKLQMNEVGMEPGIFLTPWFICLFTKGFINSVSAYLINYILLQIQNYRIGFILLKISLALIASVITKQDTITLAKDFRTFKDIIETRVFEVSLEEIRENLKLIELNYQVYTKIEDYYRIEKEEARQQMLKNRSRKLPLPPCNRQYPVCFHRIEMEKRIGSIEHAVILKNGYNFKDQIIENYLEDLPKQSQTNIHFTDINQCSIGRLAHICHLNANEDISVRSYKRPFQRETVHKVQLLGEEQSLEQDVHMSTLEQRFANHSEYFHIDQNYIQNEINCDEQFKKQLQQFSMEKPSVQNGDLQDTKKTQNKEKISLTAKIGYAFKKVMQKVGELNKMRELRRSQAQISSPKKG